MSSFVRNFNVIQSDVQKLVYRFQSARDGKVILELNSHLLVSERFENGKDKHLKTKELVSNNSIAVVVGIYLATTFCKYGTFYCSQLVLSVVCIQMPEVCNIRNIAWSKEYAENIGENEVAF